MENKTYIIILVSLFIVFFLGYYSGVRDSFSVSCYKEGLVPVTTPEGYKICWNKTDKYEPNQFKTDINLEMIKNGD